MNNNYSSIGEVLAYFMRLNKYATQVLLKLNQAVVTNDDTVTIQLENSTGDLFDYKVPSFSNLDKRIKEIDRQLRNIYLIRDKDNNVDIFGNELVHEPNVIDGLSIPSTFYSKPNYFFENLLNPLLYIKIPIHDHVTANSKFISSRRVILSLNTDEKKTYFNTNINKRNDIVYDKLISSLDLQGISYTFDDEILNLPPIVLRYSGNFSVLKNLGSIVDPTYNLVKRYLLDTLNYNENLNDGTINIKTINAGDTLITSNGETHLKVVSVDQQNRIVDLGLVDGYDEVVIGTNTLKIGSILSGDKYFDISIGPNESQVVFLKAIEPHDHITTQSWSSGISFTSSDLNINTTSGVMNFSDYYNAQVSDYAKLFTNIIQEQRLFIFDVVKPDPPILNINNFKISRLNKQVDNTDDTHRKSDLLARRDLLESKKKTLDTQITIDTKEWEENTSLTTEERNALRISIDNNLIKKGNVVTEIITIRQDIENEVDKLKTQKTTQPKFVIDGVWDVPTPKSTTLTGIQHPTHFKVKVTYLDSNGVQNPIPLINLVKNDGNTEVCHIPIYNLLVSHIRKNIIDVDGKLIPEPLDISDPNFRSINELPERISIDVMSGEQVQIQVQTCIATINSEVCSDWSDPIIMKASENLVPQIKALESIDDKLKYYYEVDTRNDDVAQLLKQFSLLTQKVQALESLRRFDSRAVVTYVLSDADVHNYNIYLPAILPFTLTGPDSITIYAVGGLRAQRGVDYEVYNNETVAWNGMGFDGKLQPGDKITITYMDGL